MNSSQLMFLVILAGTLGLFISERLRVDIVAMIALLALAFTGILTPAEALAGFSSEPAIIVAAVFVISAAMNSTGLTENIGNVMARVSGSREWRAVLTIMPTVAVLAALSHHLMVTAMMLPIVLKLCRDRGLVASRLLMPMSLAASLGTTLTLFSAPAFLLTSNMLMRQGNAELGVFAITPIGGALVLLGIVYMFVGRWLLPRRAAPADEAEYLQSNRYYTELVLRSDSPWVGQSLTSFRTHIERRLEFVEWLRNGIPNVHLPDARLDAGDVFIVRASSDELASIANERGIQLHALAKYGAAARVRNGGAEEAQLVQVMVASDSPFIGSSIGEIDFLHTLGVLVVGLWRRDGWVSEEISKLRLREGDLLVLHGTPSTFVEVSRHRGFLMMMPFMAKARHRHRALVALGIIGATVAAAATNVFPTSLLFLAAAIALIVSGCVSIEQAYKEIDVRVCVMIAGVVPLGMAMQETGTAALMAGYLHVLTADWGSLAVLLVLFWAAALLTQILSDAATVVLLVPVALALAHKLDMTPEPFAVCTALGAVVAFLTPIGHHGNLLILSPGRYTFGDFLRLGLPLTVLISLVSAWLARSLWLDGPLLPG